MKNLLQILLCTLFLLACDSEDASIEIYKTNDLVIKKLTDHLFIHQSFLDIPNYGFFPCNGLLYIKENEAIVFDTPTSDSVSQELIDWMYSMNPKIKIKAVVINHFHVDCLGGLGTFHKHRIPSYATQSCIEFAKIDSTYIPQNAFEDRLVLSLGKDEVENRWFGAAHSHDNIVSYIKSENALFGGCQIKAMGASKGNLNDADTDQWPITVASIRKAYPELKLVIPGHGNPGGKELLDYTVNLFEGK